MNIGKVRGRPKKDPNEVLSENIHIRCSKEDIRMLEELKNRSKLNRETVLRTIIKKAYNDIMLT